MTDRVVSYSFRANFAQFAAGLTTAGRGVQDLGVKLTALDRNGAKARQGLATLGGAAGKVGLVAAVGLGAAVLASANFEQAMSRIDAATHETAANMGLLRAAAIEAGAKTVFSAGEAADAITALAKAGVSTKDILGGALSASLSLASAGELDVAQAADIAATALNQFGLGGDNASHVADLLAAGAGKAQGEVTDMAAALKYVGPVAHQMGISIEETTGTIAELASQGILGEQAGTSLRGMLTSLTSPSHMASEELKKYNIELYDAQGQFVGLSGVAGQLQTAFGTLGSEERDQALGRIFGNEQITAARILYAGGAEAVKKWTAAVDADGYAADTAARKLDNLKGDLESLKGSFETALIGAGDGSQGPLRNLVQTTTSVVNGLNTIPGPAKNAAAGLLAITAITGGGLWFGSKVVGGISAAKLALANLGFQAGTTKAALSSLSVIGASTAIGLGTLLDGLSLLDSRSRSNAATDATVKSFQDLNDALSASNVGKYASDLGINIGRLSQELLDSGESGEYVQRVLDDLAEHSHGAGAAINSLAGNTLPFFTAKADKAYDANKDLNSIIDASGDVLGSAARATEAAANSTDTYGKSMVTTAKAAGLTAKELSNLTKAMEEQRKAALGAFDAETQYRQALKDAVEQGKKSDAGIKGNSEAALKNRDTISALAGAWNNQSNALQNTKGKYAQARTDFISTATAMGVPIKEARRLANRFLELPNSKVIPVSTPGLAGAISKTGQLARMLRDPIFDKLGLGNLAAGLSGQKKPSLLNQYVNPEPRGPVKPHWSGGYTGDGGKYEPAGIVHKREFVFSSEATQGNEMMLDNLHHQLRGYAGGGLVGGGLGAYINRDLDMKFPKTLKEWEQALKTSTKTIEKDTSVRDDLISRRSDLASEVTGKFQSDLFGDKPTNWVYMSEADRQRYLTQHPIDVANKDASGAASFKALLRTLAKDGLNGDAFAALAQSGDIATAQAYANNPAQIAAFEKAFNLRSRESATVGSVAGSLRFDPEIKKATSELREANIHHRQILHEINDAKRDARKNAHIIANGVNGANSHRAGQLRVG